jgi:hypothetical protein
VRIEKRLRALESRFIKDPVVLYFADGTTREIRGHGDFLLNLVADACRGTDRGPGQAAQLDLIRQSVAAQEPGGGRLTEVIRVLLESAEEEEIPGGPF